MIFAPMLRNTRETNPATITCCYTATSNNLGEQSTSKKNKRRDIGVLCMNFSPVFLLSVNCWRLKAGTWLNSGCLSARVASSSARCTVAEWSSDSAQWHSARQSGKWQCKVHSARVASNSAGCIVASGISQFPTAA